MNNRNDIFRVNSTVLRNYNNIEAFEFVNIDDFKALAVKYYVKGINNPIIEHIANWNDLKTIEDLNNNLIYQSLCHTFPEYKIHFLYAIKNVNFCPFANDTINKDNNIYVLREIDKRDREKISLGVFDNQEVYEIKHVLEKAAKENNNGRSYEIETFILNKLTLLKRRINS